MKPEEALLTFNKRLNKLTVERAYSIDKFEAKQVNFFIALVVGKAIKTHNSILILCTNGYGEDACILTRSLLETLIDLIYILNDKKEARMKRYMDYSWIIKREYLGALTSHSGNTGYNEDNVKQEDRRKILTEAENAQKKYDYRFNRWSDKNRWEMAKDVGMLLDYEIPYKMMSGFAHTDALGLDNFAGLDAKGSPLINMSPSEKNVGLALASTFEYMFKIVEKWNEILKLGMEKNLKDLAEEYASAMKLITAK